MAYESKTPFDVLENFLSVAGAKIVEVLKVYLALTVDLLRLGADLPGRVELLVIDRAYTIISYLRKVDPLNGDLDYLCSLMGALGGRLDVDDEEAAPSPHLLLLPQYLQLLFLCMLFIFATLLRCGLLALQSMIGIFMLAVQVVQERLVASESHTAEFAEVSGNLADSQVPLKLLLPAISVPTWTDYRKKSKYFEHNQKSNIRWL